MVETSRSMMAAGTVLLTIFQTQERIS